MSSDVKHIIDFSAIGVTLASAIHAIPTVAAILSIIWMALRIIESPTVQKLLKKVGLSWM